MPIPEIDLHDRQLVVHLECNARVDMSRLAAFFSAIDLEANRYFAGDPELELVRLHAGSVTAYITAWGAVVGGGATVGMFALALAKYIEERRDKTVSRRAADLCLDDGVVEIAIDAKGITRARIPANSIKAIESVLRSRQRRQEIADLREYEEAGWDYLETEDGEMLRDESGKPLVVGEARIGDRLVSHAASGLTQKFIFVATPLNDGFLNLLNQAIRPAAQDQGFEVRHVGLKEFTSQETVIERIQSEIREADIVLVDISVINSNVMFELGFAQALQKAIIVICEKRSLNISAIPFDIKHHQILVYDRQHLGEFTANLAKEFRSIA